jgi:hypothetical protein
MSIQLVALFAIATTTIVMQPISTPVLEMANGIGRIELQQWPTAMKAVRKQAVSCCTSSDGRRNSTQSSSVPSRPVGCAAVGISPAQNSQSQRDTGTEESFEVGVSGTPCCLIFFYQEADFCLQQSDDDGWTVVMCRIVP